LGFSTHLLFLNAVDLEIVFVIFVAKEFASSTHLSIKKFDNKPLAIFWIFNKSKQKQASGQLCHVLCI
jgi:hypothetical protein